MRTPQERPHPKQATAFDAACTLVETALAGTARQEIVADVSKSKDLRTGLLRLRESMRANVWKIGTRRLALDKVVNKHESHTRQGGFHVLHDWDGKVERVTRETIPVDVLKYLIAERGAGPPNRTVLAILLDYYFLYVLALLSLRVWDEGDANDHLDRLNHLLRDLQGPHGSGQLFADNAETLSVIATSHYELVEQAYDALLAKARTLNHAHRLSMALVHAAALGSHLRFGFEVTYTRDTVLMREDNGVDYRWLCFALADVMREYARMHDAGIQGMDREIVVGALLNGLSPDARAFVGDPPASLAACKDERSEFCDLFHTHKQDLLEEFERYRPTDGTYSPLSFFYNFSYNILKGTVVDALLRGEAWPLTMNDLMTGLPAGDPKGASKEMLANTLMGYSRKHPDMIGGRLSPVIVYDPQAGRRAFALAMGKITSSRSSV